MSSLVRRASDLYSRNRTAELKRLARASWPDEPERLPHPGAAEVCRYAFIRDTQAGKIEAHLWRARAMTGAALRGERRTTAGLLLQAFFAATGMATAQPVAANPPDRARGHAHARAILEEIKRLLPSRGRDWKELFERLYHEKRAASFMLEASSANPATAKYRRLLTQASHEYSAALAAAQGRRDVVKVRGGKALADYLNLSSRSAPASSIEPLIQVTEQVANEAKECQARDVQRWATANLEVMKRGATAGWVPYEVL